MLFFIKKGRTFVATHISKKPFDFGVGQAIHSRTVVIKIGDRRVDLVNLKPLDFREFVETSLLFQPLLQFFQSQHRFCGFERVRTFCTFPFFSRSPENQTQGVGSCEFVFHQIQVTDYRTVLWKTAGGTVDLKPDHSQGNECSENNPESDDLLRVTSDPFF